MRVKGPRNSPDRGDRNFGTWACRILGTSAGRAARLFAAAFGRGVVLEFSEEASQLLDHILVYFARFQLISENLSIKLV